MTDATQLPQLTLTPELSVADTATAVAAAPVVDEAARQKERDAHAVKLDESRLTDEERKLVDEFAAKIDITDSNV
ncbi:MAG: toxic anion resistance protein, partial [Oscillospiraceae bacterium]